MKEELYVLTSSGFEKADLSEPSGIQLNFKSSLFGDLSKVSCSHTYTFKLPMTINNRRIFDFAEDIRHQSCMIRKRLVASYSQNGINLFQNANLYIESAGTSYNAVMTWDVIVGLSVLKEKDISLRELPNDNSETYFGEVDTTTQEESFDNTALIIHPLYSCGLPNYLWDLPYTDANNRGRTRGRYVYPGSFPMPVVPVYKLLQIINSHFGTKFNLGKAIPLGQGNNFDPQKEIVEKGVLPLVGKDLNYEERFLRKCYLTGFNHTYVNTTICEENELHIIDAIHFTQVVCGKSGDYLEPGTLKLYKHDVSGTKVPNVGVHPTVNNISIEIDGCLRVTFADYPSNTQIPSEVPALSIYQRQQVHKRELNDGRTSHRTYYEWTELDSIDGETAGSFNGYRLYEFDFSMQNNASRLSCENLKSLGGGAIIFVFSQRIKSIVSVQKDIEIFLKNNSKCIAPHMIDVISNLPDISCLTFVKSLFYMMGAFPSVNASQEIVPRFFLELHDNLISGNVLDWSDKLPGAATDMPMEIKYSASDFAQTNYYLTKSDDLDKEYDPEDIEDDVYASGAGSIIVENSTLDISKTIIQVPFFSPYILNRKTPSIDTGCTIKCWELADEPDPRDGYNTLVFCKPEPALGIIKDRDITKGLNTGEVKVEGQVMTMEIWNGFSTLSNNPSYQFLQSIVKKPFVIKEMLLLNEFDLLDLDYIKPVYLDKYNSYFAIVSIQRDSKGKCTCELIKLQ